MDIFVELEKMRRDHIYCDDCWKRGCCRDDAGEKCTCGADKHNAILDSIIGFLRSGRYMSLCNVWIEEVTVFDKMSGKEELIALEFAAWLNQRVI